MRLTAPAALGASLSHHQNDDIPPSSGIEIPRYSVSAAAGIKLGGHVQNVNAPPKILAANETWFDYLLPGSAALSRSIVFRYVALAASGAVSRAFSAALMASG